MHILRTLLIGTAATTVVLACSGGDGDGDGDSCGGCPHDYTGFDKGAPVSLKNDLMPIISRACNFSSCHGRAGSNPPGSMFLGPNSPTFKAMGIDDVTLAQVHTALVAPAVTTTTAPRITPGDPSNSFLIMKLDGCQGAAVPCMVQQGSTSGGICGDPMPQTSGGTAALLPCGERDLIRRWVAHGALLN